MQVLERSAQACKACIADFAFNNGLKLLSHWQIQQPSSRAVYGGVHRGPAGLTYMPSYQS